MLDTLWAARLTPAFTAFGSPVSWLEMVAFVLATLNAVARVYLGAHNPLDVVGGAAIGLAIAAGLDLVFDVARDRGGGWRGQAASAGEERAT